MSLTALQMAVPFYSLFPRLPVMSFFHMLTLLLLGYAIMRFTKDWLRSLFIDRKKTAYYAGGTLVYAALVSFMHIAWRYPGDISPAYFGPFLMLLCALLFYADACCKEWIRDHTWLSRFSMGVYGLSVLAIFLSLESPMFRIITLALGAFVYGSVIWQYLTLTPLWLLTACLSALYGLLILQYLPRESHFLAAVPGLVALMGMQMLAMKRNARTLARTVFRIRGGLGGALAVWSLWNSGPGLSAFFTCMSLCVFIWFNLRNAPEFLFESVKFFQVKTEKEEKRDLRDTPLFYALPFCWMLTFAYAPALMGIPSPLQFASALLLLSLVWTETGLRLYHKNPDIPRVPMFLNSALLSLFLSIGIRLFYLTPDIKRIFLIPVLAAASLILFRQSLALRDRFLFSLALVPGGAAGIYIKYMFFPASSGGMTVLLLSLILWGITWYLQRLQIIYVALNEEFPQKAPLILLGIHQIRPRFLPEVFAYPLSFAMMLLWMAGLFKCGMGLVHSGPTLFWAVKAALATLLTALILMRFRMLRLWPFPMLMGLGTFLALIRPFIPWTLETIPVAVCFYALAAWITVRIILSAPRLPHLAEILHLNGGHTGSGRQQMEKQTHATAYMLCIISVLTAVFFWFIQPGLDLLPILFTAMIFTYLSGRIYGKPSYANDLLAMFTMAALVLHVHFLQITDIRVLPADPRSGMLAAFLGIFMTCFGKAVKNRKEEEKDLYAGALNRFSTILLLSSACQLFFLTISGMPVHPLLIAGLSLSSVGMLAAYHMEKKEWQNGMGIFLFSLTLLCTQIFVFHPGNAFSFWPENMDAWIFIALMALLTASVSIIFPAVSNIYLRSFRGISKLCYAWALFKTAPLLGLLLTGDSVSPVIPVFFGIMAFTLFPVTEKLHKAAHWRGIALLVFGSGIWFSTVSLRIFPLAMSQAVPLWSWILLLSGSFALPFWNEKFPRWKSEALVWPWAGLILAAFCLPVTRGLAYSFSTVSYWAGLSVFFFLMLRLTANSVPVWLSLLTLSFSLAAFLARLPSDESMVYGILIWGNLLLAAIPLWNRYISKILFRLGWKTFDPVPPLRIIPAFIFGLSLILLGFLDGVALLSPDAIHSSQNFLMGASLILAFSFLHLYLRKKGRVWIQGIMLSFLCLILNARIFIPGLPSLSLLLAAWTVLLLGLYQGLDTVRKRTEEQSGNSEARESALSPFLSVLSGWLSFTPLTALACFLFLPHHSFAETVLTLAFLGIVMAAVGGVKQQGFMKKTAKVLGLIFLHMWPLAFLPAKKGAAFSIWQIIPLLIAKFQQIQVLFPFYALELAILAWIIIGLRRMAAGNAGEKYPVLRKMKLRYGFISGLAFCEWGLHFFLFLQTGGVVTTADAHLSFIQAAAFLLTGILLTALGIRQMKQNPRPARVYGLFLMSGITAFYLRIIFFGMAPPCIWDTVLMLSAAWIFAIWSRNTETEYLSLPMMRISTALSLFLFFTFPWQMNSVHASSALLLCGLLWLSHYHATEKSIFLYGAVFLLNTALYLWIPQWSQNCNLMQLYAVPVCISLLAILHLHRKELKRSVLNTSRMTVVCVLYASASLDVFLRPELSVFILVLGLSLLGIIAGIAMQVRAFLFGGVIFMVMNVMNQLLRFYPEHRLGKGIVLVATGAAIMSAMIWFSIQKEDIMKRIRIIRADLAGWE
ncbi:MAG: hypothetical protein V2I97_17495 [Desulfococcaceae bacterium]|jgi:hypothetical protein|nr:hypothetical protein [Desulfococcaceae bacterium]